MIWDSKLVACQSSQLLDLEDRTTHIRSVAKKSVSVVSITEEVSNNAKHALGLDSVCQHVHVLQVNGHETCGHDNAHHVEPLNVTLSHHASLKCHYDGDYHDQVGCKLSLKLVFWVAIQMLYKLVQFFDFVTKHFPHNFVILVFAQVLADLLLLTITTLVSSNSCTMSPGCLLHGRN